MLHHDFFPSFPDQARVWVYAASEPIDAESARALEADIKEFIQRWTSHGRPVVAEARLFEGQFLLVSGYVEKSQVSGCGIDASVRALDEAAARRGIGWASPLDVFFRDDTGRVCRTSRGEFRKMAQSGTVGPSTTTFDPSVTSVGDLREGRFETSAGASWHRRLLNETAASAGP